MGSLLELKPRAIKVKVDGTDVDVYGISIKGAIDVLGQFPTLQKIFSDIDVKPDDLMALIGDAAAPVIAAGCGFAGDKKAEEIARKLDLGTQAEFVTAIWELTFPKGVGPLVQQLTKMNLPVKSIDLSPKDPETKSQRQQKR